jgi:hypothetical protein
VVAALEGCDEVSNDALVRVLAETQFQRRSGGRRRYLIRGILAGSCLGRLVLPRAVATQSPVDLFFQQFLHPPEEVFHQFWLTCEKLGARLLQDLVRPLREDLCKRYQFVLDDGDGLPDRLIGSRTFFIGKSASSLPSLHRSLRPASSSLPVVAHLSSSLR